MSGLCTSRLCRIRDYVVKDCVAFGIMSLKIVSHLGLLYVSSIRYSIVHANDVQDNFVRVYINLDYVIRNTVGVPGELY